MRRTGMGIKLFRDMAHQMRKSSGQLVEQDVRKGRGVGLRIRKLEI